MKHLYIKTKFVLFLLASMIGVIVVEAADITSTAQGGKWSDKTTWVGGLVPKETDNVIITSTVIARGGGFTSNTYPMFNLTINSGGKIIKEKNSEGSYLKISGNLTNNGEIIDYDGWFVIDLYGNLINNGVLKSGNINLLGANQQLSGTVAIECKQINLNMTDEFAVAASNLIFKNCEVYSRASTPIEKLKMGKYSLSLFADSITYDAYSGRVYSSSEIRVPIVFDGIGILNVENSVVGGTIYGNVIVKSPSYAFFKDLTIEGNLTLDEGAKVSSQSNGEELRVKGDFINYANLNKDTVKVRQVKFAPRTMYLYLYGNSNNLGSTGLSRVYPITNGKTISLKGNYDADVFIRQAENNDKPGGKVLINSEVNISGRLDVYGNLEIGAGGVLNLLNRKSTALSVRPEYGGSLTNKGKMNMYHWVNNDQYYRSFSSQPGMNVDYELRSWDGRIEGLDVTVNNGQAYPGLPGSVKRWWRINPVGTGKVKNYILKLYYDETMLNGQKEKNLKVFRSGDKGTTWELVSLGSNAVLDTIGNSITIGKSNIAASMLTEFGDFVISSGDGSVPIPSPIIVNLIGSTGVRLGAPNRYTVHLYNAGNYRSESFMAAVTVTDDIVFKQVEIPTKEGKEILPIDSIGTAKDHTQLFFIPYLDPNEEYSFDVIVVGVNEGTKSAKAGAPTLTATGLMKAAGEDKSGDLLADEMNSWVEFTPEEAKEYAHARGLTVEQLKAKKEKDGTGAYAVKTVIKYAVEEASKTNPITAIIYKIGNTIEFVAKIKDSYRQRIFYWFQKQTDPKYDKKIMVVSGKEIKGEMRTSWDPNEKQGPTGYGISNYISSAGRMYYTIVFENKKEATAPAYRIQVVDTLSAVFNPETVKFGATSHSGVEYNWKMERVGNILKWDIEGIELPPNKTPPEGEGYVTFSVDLKDGLESGVPITNRATIVFDLNKPITTNTWSNVLDKIAPVTMMKPVYYSAGDTVVNVSCNAVDNVNGAGVGRYEFFASVDNAPFKFLGETFENTIQYPVSDSSEHNYRFYVLTTDKVNNAEKSVPQIIEFKSFPVSINKLEGINNGMKLYPNPTSGNITIDFFTEGQTAVKIQLYSMTGELLKTIQKGSVEAGQNRIDFDISDLSQGVYFAKVILNKNSETFKVIKN